jgi:hypothetical protein
MKNVRERMKERVFERVWERIMGKVPRDPQSKVSGQAWMIAGEVLAIFEAQIFDLAEHSCGCMVLWVGGCNKEGSLCQAHQTPPDVVFRADRLQYMQISMTPNERLKEALLSGDIEEARKAYAELD